ncbi:molybdenum cofactor guanylyltransferase [Ornithinimicrobium sp. INDO-MA30-4]|uniref:molybdenum cofactor guanylyltransferase n=1 Tax=Ornithinimicrobium sp. INDO-MA30-4 TaxID=2908651 RepID=UPI001F20795F|nr:NTP transferase domain-containing protein [Ornithinimicrobium sp. INDO-MA30-4]UJH70230.1 NTP transferase domain-containing protein [Ornithinimicrobium sp. INDO-MA30-4]
MKVNAIVLVGGAGRRLGGVDKAGLQVGGVSLLGRTLGAIQPVTESVVVVGETAERSSLLASLREAVTWTQERPAGGGPVAGVIAGLSAVQVDRDWTLLLAVDQPGVRAVLPALVAAAEQAEVDVEAVAPIDESGRTQWLLAAYRTAVLREALSQAGTGHNQALRSLLKPLRMQEVAVDPADLRDVDEWVDVQAWRERLS